MFARGHNSRSPNYLFSKGNWYSVEEAQKAGLKQEVLKVDGDRLLNTAVEDMCAHLAHQFRVDVPVLMKDDLEVEQQETQIDVSRDQMRAIRDRSQPCYIPATAIIVTIPFTGEDVVFDIQPTSYSMSPPSGVVRSGVLTLRLEGLELKPEAVKVWIDRTVSEIESHLNTLRGSADALNGQLLTLAQAHVMNRREKLLSDRNMVAQLGYKLKERPGTPKTYTAPVSRQKIAPALPPVSNAKFKPEPALSTETFEHVIKVINNMAQVMERSPSAFASIDEESLRSHFLVQLNGHYEGQAVGEAFNYTGKTDILIRSDGKNIFVAECKYWGGPKVLLGTLDQVLGYSCWRDTKVAVILFNRNRDFTKVLETIKDTVRNHPSYKRQLDPKSETDFRYVFGHRDDANRELLLAVLAFDVPTLG